jgi:hypothetical protein
MVDLLKKKVGIVACSGEELPEGTVTRLASLKVLEELRPAETVTICLPLFLAGGEGDRAFARFYPTIAVDGCDLCCAARGTEMYSGKPAASVVVTQVIEEDGLDAPTGCRRLDEAGQAAIKATAERVADLVDGLLDKRWNRRTGEFVEDLPAAQASKEVIPVVDQTAASCACGSGIPVQKIALDGEVMTLVALPLIFENMLNKAKAPDDQTAAEILEMVKIYNPIPDEREASYIQELRDAYSDYCLNQERIR